MDYTALTKIALFAGISEREVELLLAEFKVKETHFERGEILALQDEPCNRLIILLSGAAKGEMSNPSGKVMKVEDIVAPNPLAILFLFGPQNRFPVQVTATEKSSAVIIPKQVVLKMLTRSEALLQNYLDISASFAVRLSRKLQMSLRTIRQKLAIHLIELAQKSGSNTVHPDKTHAALAEYFGVSRQALEREIKNMVADGMLSTSGKQITLTNKKELEGLINF